MNINITRILSIISFCIISVSQSFSQNSSKIPPEKPKLIIGIVVDQMRYDYLARFWNQFGEGGFKRLVNEGANCRNANYTHFFTQTGVNYACLVAGTTPSYHGIVADEWYVPLKNQVVNCVDDDKEKSVGGSYESGRLSPKNILTTTIGDEIRLSTFMQSKVISISLDGKTSVIAGGHTANAAYWFDGETGNWVSGSYYMNNLPVWVNDFNTKKFPDMYMSRRWETKLPIEQYTQCLTDDNPYEIGIMGKRTFPYALYELGGTKNKDKFNYKLLKTTPYGNTLTSDFAINAIVNENLGKDDNTDLLMISFAATESIGQAFGNASIEVMDAFLKLDEDIAHFLSFVDTEIGKQNVMIFFTSDHGAAANPDYLATTKIPVGYFSQVSSVSLLKSYLNAIYGKGDWVKFYYAQQVYLNHDLIEESKLNLADVQNKTAQFLLQFTGVSNTVTATTLQNAYFSDGIFAKMQKSYNQKRSGDVMINLDPGWSEKNGSAASHNSSYSYDTHVPLIWYGWKVKRGSVFEKVDMTDVAPTISYFLEIASPNASSGQPIQGVVNQ
jgi:predicted AlkP superfamily pyrophosphatase or phosphodiesterase